MQKYCSKCKIFKDINSFSLRKKSKDGYNGRCKECISNYNKKYKQKHAEEHKTKYKEKRKEYSIKNKENILNYQKEYRKQNKTAIKHYQKQWYIKNKEKRKLYISNNRKRINEYYKKYNPSLNAKIAKLLHTNILASVKRANVKKLFLSIKLLGYSIDFFKKYIESKFTTNMSWDNYGVDGWHYDHIKPCSSFNLTDPEQQKLCFHYSNYQPLWATKKIAILHGETPEYIGNLEKGYKYNENFSC